MLLPKSFTNLINNLTILPGVGEKTAERYVYSIYERDIQEIEQLSSSLLEFKKNIKNCSICGCLSDTDICEVCQDESRNNGVICIVENSKSAFFIEKTGKFGGYYHILNGLISPIEGINPENLNIFSLIDKRINKNVKEIIIALNPSIEGEVTSLYLKKILEKFDIKISRLSYGIPIGGDIEYLDPLMISKALEDRKVITE